MPLIAFEYALRYFREVEPTSSVGMVPEPPGLQPAGLGSGPPAQSQNAFDFVDVIGGFAFKTLDDEAVLAT